MEQDKYKRKPSGNRALVGLFLIGGGILLLINKMGIAILPGWFFTWPILIIAIGLLVGIQHNFRHFGWVLLTAWGIFWLLDQQMPSLNLRNYSAPIVLIFLGLFFIFRRKHSKLKEWNKERWKQYHKERYTDYVDIPASTEDGEFIDSTSIFSGAKKVVVSKNFKGGDITCFMGGAEIDLSQADIQGKAVIDATAVFGGIKLIVPSNWDVKIENHAVFGNVEDKRRMQSFNIDPNKQLIIDGTAVFGGIEIQNF